MANIIKKSYSIFHRYFVELPTNLYFANQVFSDDKKTYLVVNDHIGDFLIAMGYLQAFRDHYHVEHLVLCTTPKMKNIALLYSCHEDEILCFEYQELKKLLFLPTIKTASEWVKKKGNIYFACPIDFQTISYDYYLSAFPGITLRQAILYGCLRLPEDAVYQPLPVREKTVSGRKPAIILCPASQNGWWEDYAPKEFIEYLTQFLGKYDVDLYTNISPYDSVASTLPSTRPLCMSLDELGNWIVPGDIVIGIRSGIMDFLSYYDCHIICLYAPVHWFSSFYTLDMLPGKRCHYVEHIIEGSLEYNLQQVLRSVDKYLALTS